MYEYEKRGIQRMILFRIELFAHVSVFTLNHHRGKKKFVMLYRLNYVYHR